MTQFFPQKIFRTLHLFCLYFPQNIFCTVPVVDFPHFTLGQIFYHIFVAYCIGGMVSLLQVIAALAVLVVVVFGMWFLVMVVEVFVVLKLAEAVP